MKPGMTRMMIDFDTLSRSEAMGGKNREGLFLVQKNEGWLHGGESI